MGGRRLKERGGGGTAESGSIRPITSLQILATIIDHETDPSVVLQIDAEACTDFEDLDEVEQQRIL